VRSPRGKGRNDGALHEINRLWTSPAQVRQSINDRK